MCNHMQPLLLFNKMSRLLESSLDDSIIKVVGTNVSYLLPAIDYIPQRIQEQLWLLCGHQSFTFGIISSKGVYKVKSNFLIELETYVEAESYVTKKSDKKRKFVDLE